LGALYIYQINSVSRDDGEIYFKKLLSLLEFKIMVYLPGRREIVPQKTDNLAFRVVNRLTDGDYHCH
jgi:hypothetical protein